ncbi:MAG: protein adenylyltransferase SelO [Myxococcota bacterium]
MQITFDNTYTDLPDRFFARCEPASVPDPRTIRVNEALAEQLGFDAEWLESEQGAEFAVGNRILEGSEPIAMAYAGHQFGNFVSQLGDGRALLLGEVLDEDGERFDIQLKGSGRTPFSRRGDGRAPLGPVLREYIVSEAMYALGIPTTRSLVAASSGGRVRRETILPGGVLVRVARSHVRVGTFEYFAAREDRDALQTLMAYVVDRHFPDVDPESPVELLDAVAKRQASLVAQWQLVGFIHGVMNTDNMLLSGETIDYGPCAFMNAFDPETVYSSIDRRGRYAYRNQPGIAQWNLSRLAEALLVVVDGDEAVVAEAQDVIDAFPDRLRDAYADGMAAKLGLDGFDEDSWELATDLLALMHENGTDFTLAFRRLSELADPGRSQGRSVGEVFSFPEAFDPWLDRWRARLRASQRSSEDIATGMRTVNPVVIPRNHHVAAVLEAAVERSDFEPFHTLVDAVTRPFEFPKQREELVEPPAPDEEIAATFCGT